MFGFVSRHRVSLIALAVVVAVGSVSMSSRKAPSLAAYVWAICATNLRSEPPSEEPFISENVDAMTKMMSAMEISPSGDVDRDFVAMMVPHHQGAVRMAQALLRYGHNERLRRMAQEIIVTQQQEIAAMGLALDAALPPSDMASDQPLDARQ